MSTQYTYVIPFDESTYFSSIPHEQSSKVLKCRSKLIYTDEAIIAGLKARDTEIINYVYQKSYNQVKFLVTSNSGTQMDSEDVFQDALFLLYQKISKETLKLTSSFSTYLYAICRHLWLQKLSRNRINYEYKEAMNLDEWQDKNTIDEQIEEYEKYKLFHQHFLKLKPNDQKVLKLFMSKISLKEIAHIMGYKSDKYAKVRKYICKEKLKNSIINDPRYQEIYRSEHLTPVFSC
jgi:RNA polymerase sigma factor (sigma-70 family)